MANFAAGVSSPSAENIQLTNQSLRLLFSQKESAQILGISLRTLQNLIADKQLPVCRIGRRVLVRRKDLETFVRHDHLQLGGR